MTPDSVVHAVVTRLHNPRVKLGLRRIAIDAVSVIVVGVCAVAYLKTNILQPIPGLVHESDFSVYYRAAKDVVSGVSPYENPAYFYPPVLGFVMAPFALTVYVAARWIWFLLSHLFLLSAAWFVWRAAGRGRIAMCCVAVVWAFGGAAKETLDVGQLSPLLVLVLAAAYTQRDRMREAAVVTGFALKYIPGVVGIALVLQRRWRALAGFIAAAAVSVLIPWVALSVAFKGPKAPVSAHYWMGTPSIFSWSVPSVVLRILNPIVRGATLRQDWEFGNTAGVFHLSPAMEWISVSSAALTLAAGIAALFFACGGRLRKEQIPWAMIGLLSLSLAAAPVCWSHYQILQYPGVAMLLASSIKQRAWWITAGVAVCFALIYEVPQVMLVEYHDVHGGWTALSPATLNLWPAAPPLACLGLFCLALWNVRRTGWARLKIVITGRTRDAAPVLSGR